MRISFKLQRGATADGLATFSKTLWGKFWNSLLLVLFLLSWNAAAEAAIPDLVWAKNFGSSGYTYPFATAVDAEGNAYLAGQFSSSTLTFGSTVLARIGTSDAFIVKFDPAGEVLWARGYGGGGTSTTGKSLAVDTIGNVFFGGAMHGDMTTPPLTKIGGYFDGFLLKLDSAGNTLWAKSYGGYGASVDVRTLATDRSGNAYWSGSFGDGSLSTPSLTRIGKTDALLVKVDPSGNTVWARNYGGTGRWAKTTAGGYAVTTDGEGNAYLVGIYDQGLSVPLVEEIGQESTFAMKVNASGSVVWAKGFGGVEREGGFLVGSAVVSGRAVALDGGGNIYLCGTFTTPLRSSSLPWITIGDWDAFAIKLDPSGNTAWVRNFGGAGVGEAVDPAFPGSSTSCDGVALDVLGNVYLGGWFDRYSLTTPPLALVGGSSYHMNGLLIQLDAAGNTLDAKAYAGNAAGAVIKGLTSDGSGNVYLGGYFSSGNLIDPALILKGWVDGMIFKLGGSAVPPVGYALSVTKSGNGAVTSTPAGISCGSNCSANFAAGSVVTLTAIPAAGTSFYGWSGACSGTGSSCSVTMSEARSVTASFLEARIANNPEQKGGAKKNRDTAFRGSSCSAPGWPTHSVNTATLNLVVSDTDFAYSGLGPAVSLTRVWNSDPSTLGMFGRGWSFPYESSFVSGNQITINGAGGQGTQFTYVSGTTTATYAPVIAGIFDTLVGYLGSSSSYWLYTRKDTRDVYRYDSSSSTSGIARLTSITDRNGNALSITYNQDGTLAGITDAAGRTTFFNYNASKRVTRMTVPDGQSLSYNYDANGNMIGNVDLLGTAISYTYDSGNYLTSMTVDGRTTAFAYGASGGWFHVATVTDPMGKVETYNATSWSRTTVTDANNHTIAYASEDGKTTSVTDANNHLWSRSYSNSLLSSMTDANGKINSFRWDARGNLTRQIDPLNRFSEYVYDANDDLIQSTDPQNTTWTLTRDFKGKVTTATSPMNKKTMLAYNTLGQLTSSTDPAGRTTTYTYDSKGNLQKVISPLGAFVTAGYDAQGINLTSIADERNNTSNFAYDSNGRLTRVTHPDGSFATVGYSACAMSSVTDENGKQTAFTRDKNLEVTRITDPSGSNVSITYDSVGNLLTTTDPLSRVYGNSYDAGNRLMAVVNPLGGSLSFGRDNNGNVTQVTDERSNATVLGYDPRNLLVTVTDPSGQVVSTTRDSLGRVAQITNARGGIRSYTYDDDGRVSGKTYGAFSAASYAYDNSGLLTSATDAEGTVSYTYDAGGRLNRMAYPDGSSVSLTRDSAGNVTGMTYPGGLNVTYVYDNRNRIQSMSWGANSIAYTYDAAGNRLSETRSNSTGSSYTYNANGRLTGISHKKGAVAFATLSYSRDAAGNIISETADLPVQPVPVNIRGVATVNNNNQLVSWGSASYSYDADGNLTSVVGTSPFSAIYDARNLPTLITRGGSSAEYHYDGMLNRVKSISGSSTRNFHYDHVGRLLFETDGSGTVTTTYLYQGRKLAAMQAADGNMYFYHFDKTGNTVALTNSSGTVVAAYAYSPYGAVLGRSGSVINPFTYVGAYGVMDEGNNLYYMKNRYYDAGTGRFLQKDPIGFAGRQSNLYAYVAGNPVGRIDPTGLADDDSQLGATELWLKQHPENTPEHRRKLHDIRFAEDLLRYKLEAVAAYNETWSDKFSWFVERELPLYVVVQRAPWGRDSESFKFIDEKGLPRIPTWDNMFDDWVRVPYEEIALCDR
jgi:RHS repeat-associated protein